MAVITISRQMGSLGREIGQQVARKLGYRLLWRELIHQAALRASEPEMALATIDELGLLGLEPNPQSQARYLASLREVLIEWADQDNVVIVGRASQVVLSGRPDTIHVRVVAPINARIERIAYRHQISREAGQAQVETSDRCRRDYLSTQYQTDWGDPDLYDLVINTGRVSVEAAVDIVVALAIHKLGIQV